MTFLTDEEMKSMSQFEIKQKIQDNKATIEKAVATFVLNPDIQKLIVENNKLEKLVK